MNRRKFLRCFAALPALPIAVVVGKALAAPKTVYRIPPIKTVSWRKLYQGVKK